MANSVFQNNSPTELYHRMEVEGHCPEGGERFSRKAVVIVAGGVLLRPPAPAQAATDETSNQLDLFHT
jgi:hypothetical protein